MSTSMNTQMINLALTAQKPSESKFRFFDLPGELRNSIYSIAVEGERNILGCCVLPPIAQASRQLRRECLPVFFQETEFHIELHPDTPVNLSCDPLGLNAVARHYTQELGDNAAFRHVTFWVSDPVDDIDAGTWGLYETRSSEYSMTLKVERTPRARIFSVKVELSLEERNSWCLDADGVDSDVQRAQEKAESFAARETFSGFTLDDLRDIAKLLTSSSAD